MWFEGKMISWKEKCMMLDSEPDQASCHAIHFACMAYWNVYKEN